MPSMDPPADAVFFISDAHLGAAGRSAEAAREARLLRYLSWARGRCSHLYVVGDLWDFWFEYRSVVSRRAFPVVGALRALADAGARVTLMGGNHDWWLGSFLREEAGLEVSRESLTVEHQGRRILLVHGDGLAGERDRRYRMIRALFRSPASERAFRLLHPDFGFWLASRFSQLSRSVEEAEKELLHPAFAAFVERQLAAGYDAVLTGHHHKPLHVRRGKKDWIVLGDWFLHFTYGELRGGALRLVRWGDEAPAGEVAPSERGPAGP